MQTFEDNLKLIDLSNTSISLSEQNNFTYSIEGISSKLIQQEKNLQINATKQQFILTINFDLIQVQPLTPLRAQVGLFKLLVGIQYQVKANLLLSKLFDLQTLLYFMEVQTIFRKNGLIEKGYLNFSTTSQCTFLRHSIQINFTSDQAFKLKQNYITTLVIGDRSNKWPFKVQNFKVKISRDKSQRQFKSCQQKPIIQNLCIQNDFSFPLRDQLQLPKTQVTLNLSQRIQRLEQHASPASTSISQKQLYICHDMKGGYMQDTNTFTPLRQSNKTHNYRYNYMSQTRIFNYFSHHRVSLPPKMWRQLCKNYNVLCLGTFIVEGKQIRLTEDNYLNQDFALKLVYIARKAKFDGYLINIQTSVERPSLLVKWLVFLTGQINRAIPNSQIIWYDSVVSTGKIQYQNQLNNKNNQFYQACNGIFTNYWWKQSSLINSIPHIVKGKPIYIGNDCFGRNTYGGGKYDIVKAVRKIQQIAKGQLSIALFAPAFTYQDNGQHIRQSLLQNQIKMYHGSKIVTKNIEKWKYIMNGGQGWKLEDEWAVSSFELCKRQALVRISQFEGSNSTLSIYFSCFVAGTGPNFSDYYKISVEVYDYKNNIVYLQEVFPKTIASQKQELIQIRMQVDCQIISQSVCVRVLEEGKDVQNWSGNYGTRFKGEKISLIMQCDCQNWIRNIPIQPSCLDRSYTTYFNKGQGDNWYCLGQKMQTCYSHISDYDVPPIFSLNNVSDVKLYHQDSYLGGSCLRFQNTPKVTINKFILNYSDKENLNPTQEQLKYTLIIAVKDNVPLQIRCGQIKEKFWKKQTGKQVQLNGWKIFHCDLILNDNMREFVAEVTFQKDKGLIGQFSIIQTEHLLTQNYQNKNKFQVKIKYNRQSKHVLPYNFDIILQSKNNFAEKQKTEKLLVRIGQFSCFLQLQNIKQNNDSYKMRGLLKNIPIMSTKVQNFDVSIIDIRKGLSKQVLKQTIQKSILNKLIQNKQMSFQLLF